MSTDTASRATRAVGRPLRRKEDARVITGQARWTDNLTVPGLLHMAIARSPMAHARIKNADVSAVLQQPGVVAAFTGADLAEDYGSLPTAWHVSDDLIVPDHRPVAINEVRYLGDAVAVVVADGAYQAADALEAVQVDYERLPAVIDMETALAAGAPLVHADKQTNRAFTWGFTAGDYQAARRDADVGLGPSRWFGEHGYSAGGWETATVRLLPTGRVEAIVGTSPHGQGHVTSFSQIVADAIGVPFDDVDVLHGDTAIATWGLDTYGSRSLVLGGAAVAEAARKVVDQARIVAAHLLEAIPDDLEFAGGRFSVRGDPEAATTIRDVAVAAFAAHDLPRGAEPVLMAEATFDPEAFSFPHGTHLCAAEVDTRTGFVNVRSYVAVDDVGTVVNPMIVEGQIHGGVTQGLAQALYEQAVYDAAGNLVTGSLVDYLVPSAADVRPYVTDRTETPATTNPLGAKGAGEAGTIASTPAVVNAVVDALRPHGVTDVPMPCTPERVWRAIHGGHQ